MTASTSERSSRSAPTAGSATSSAQGEDGLWQALGMKVDAPRRALWVCSAEGDIPETGRALARFRFARFVPVTRVFYDAFPIMAVPPEKAAPRRGRRTGARRPVSSATRA